MLRTFSRILIAGAVLFTISAIAIWATYPAFGGFLYKSAMFIESNLYGLREKPVDIGKMTLSTLQNATPGTSKGTIVMLHGYTANKDVWLRFAGKFSDNYRVIIPDLPGHGKSPYDADLSYRYPDQAERLLALFDSTNTDKAFLLGNSMGGRLAVEFALAHPERVAKLVLFDPAGIDSPNPSTVTTTFEEQGRNVFLIDSYREFREFYDMSMAQPPFFPTIIIDWLAQDHMAKRTQNERIFWHITENWLDEKQLGELSLPVLLIWGSLDEILDVSSAELWMSTLTQRKDVASEYQRYEGLGHMPMLEAPAKSAERVKEFITQ